MLMLLRLIIVGLCYCCQVGAVESRLNPKAHAHGVGQMIVLYEAGQLFLELDMPAIHMLGFEHAPQNVKERQQLSKLKEILDVPEKIIKLQPHCQVRSIEVELPFHEGKQTYAIEKGTLETHQSDNISRHHQEALHEAHQDIHLSYEWHCNGGSPPAITLILFHLYSGFDRIEAQWIANGKQGATTLNKNNARLEIQS